MMPGKGQVEAGGGGKIRRYTVISEDFHDWMSHMSGSVTGSITRRNMTCLEAVLFRGLQAGRYVNHKHASGQMKDQDQHKVKYLYNYWTDCHETWCTLSWMNPKEDFSCSDTDGSLVQHVDGDTSKYNGHVLFSLSCSTESISNTGRDAIQASTSRSEK